MAVLPQDNPITSSDELARHKLIQALREGTFIPGQRLYEPDLLSLTGLGRTPLRQALTRLISEGLLRRTPGRKGYVLPQFTAQDREQLFVVRSALEIAACESAATHRTDTQIERLKALNSQEEALYLQALEDFSEERQQRYTSLNEDFHRLIFEASHNPYLLQCFEQIFWQTALYPVLYAPIYTGHRAPHPSWQEHRNIILAIEAQDSDAAALAMRLHLSHTQKERSEIHERTAD